MTLITAILALAFLILMLGATYFHRLAELTHDPRHYEDLKPSVAAAVLLNIDPNIYALTRKALTKQQFRRYSQGFMGFAMPRLFEEARRVTLASRSARAAWHFGLFCMAYAAVYAKFRVAAHVDDLRYLAGAELALLRRTGVPQHS